jgi:hypothetical protein
MITCEREENSHVRSILLSFSMESVCVILNKGGDNHE